MLEKIPSVHWLAILAAGVAMFLIGGVWYGALFAKLWQRLHGYTDEQVKAMQQARPPHVFFGLMIFSYLVGAFVMAVMVVSLDLNGAFAGAVLGAFLWLFATTAIGLTDHITRTRPIAAYFLDSSYQLVAFMAAGIILACWR
ncbi:MAG: DUF1761 domain-containing protein [Phycisphaerales bacterium]|nr:DUF1761 domain-containing protein [Planctomycetota bacterium]